MNNLSKYIMMQKIFEDSKEIIEQLTSPSTLTKMLEIYSNEGLKAREEKDLDLLQFQNCLYQFTLERAKEVGMDVSEYSTKLEEVFA